MDKLHNITNHHKIGDGYKRKKSSYFDFLSPKKLIMNAIRERLEGTGIIKLVLVFNTITDRYNVMLSKEDNSKLKLEIEEDEITMIKKIFVSKIVKAYAMKSDRFIKAVIIDVNFRDDDIKIFIEDMNSEVEFFDYKLL